MNFKYAHLADLHLGSWREPKMRELSTKAFLTAIQQCIELPVDFILFAGDIFNTSLPALDTLKIVTKKLKELKDLGIPLYVIAGSHDFSPSGKTMIDVLENAGLLINVCKGGVEEESSRLKLRFTEDPKTKAKITGILGRKGQLDRQYYENLNLENLEQDKGYKIFMFHTTLTELKPKHLEKIESNPASFLPKGFNYYAGGHIHHKTMVELPEYGPLTYPGALFPNNFAEVEKYGHGGYYVISVENLSSAGSTRGVAQNINWIPLQIVPHVGLTLDCERKSPEVVSFELLDYFEDKKLQDSLITIRLKGKLERGKVADVNFKQLFSTLYEKGAYFVMKNTAKLNSELFEEVMISSSNPDLVEEQLIKEHLQQVTFCDPETELQLTKSLMRALNTQKKEGETTTDFQKRVQHDVDNLLTFD